MNKSIFIFILLCVTNHLFAQQTAVFMDLNGKQLFKFKCDFIQDMQGDFAIYVIGENITDKKQVGLLNMATQEVVVQNSNLVKKISFFNEEIAIIEHSNNRKEIINLKTHKTLKKTPKIKTQGIPKQIENTYFHSTILNKNLYLVEDKNNQKGIVNQRGKIIIPIEYSNIKVVNETVFFVVDVNNRGRFFNQKGKLLSKQTFRAFQTNKYFSDKIIAFDEELKSYVFDEQFNIIEFSTNDFTIKYTMGNYCAFLKNDKYGIMDFNGKIILKAEYQYILPFDNNLWGVKKNELEAIYNPNEQTFISDFEYVNETSQLSFSDDLDIIHYFEKDGLYGIYYKEYFFPPIFIKKAFANENYFCAFEPPLKANQESFKNSIVEDKETSKPTDYTFPNVEFEYAIYYKFNINSNKIELIYHNGTLAKNAKKIKQLEENDLKKLNYIFKPLPTEYRRVSPSKCYIPRDAILFYDKNDTVVAKLEVCFECKGIRNTEALEFPMTVENWKALEKFFDELW